MSLLLLLKPRHGTQVFLSSTYPLQSELRSVNFALQGIRERCHHVQPWLFNDDHFVFAHKVHAKHTVVSQAHGAGSRNNLVTTGVRLRHGGRSLAFANMSFRKDATLVRKVNGRIHGHDRPKGSLHVTHHAKNQPVRLRVHHEYENK